MCYNGVMANAYPEWQRLSELLEIISAQGLQRLEAEEIIEFGKLYRRAAAELSFYRTHEVDPGRLAFLNDLVGRCYAHVYVAPRRPWPSVRRFYAADFPRALRRHSGWVLLAVLMSLLPALIGYVLTMHDRALADQVLPAGLMAGLDGLAQRHHTPKDWLPLLERAPSAGFIITNNIRIALLAFGGGMTAGILTALLMVYNGVMLGVVAAAVALDGHATALNFWAFVAPHGVLELTAIFIAGGAGLLLAYAIVNPGEYPRRVALRHAGREALRLMLGVASLLLVAGLIEGFFSPLNIPERIKFIAAGAEAVLLLAYLLLAGRTATDTQNSPLGELMTPLPPI